jgi:hypothetical protein
MVMTSRNSALSEDRQTSRSRISGTGAGSKPRRSVKQKMTQTTPMPVSDDERGRYVAEAAYFIAEQRGFVGGSAEEDWFAAEAEIERLFASRRH